MSKMTRVQVRLQPELLAEIDETARQLDKSRAQIIREAASLSLKDYNAHLRFVDKAQGSELVGKITSVYDLLGVIKIGVNKIGVNINQIAKQLNSSGMMLSSEKAQLLHEMSEMKKELARMEEIKKDMEIELWQFLG